MSHRDTEHLRVLMANERKDRLALVASAVVALGHEVIAREIEVEDVAAVTVRERPDVAFVGLGESSQHALELERALSDPDPVRGIALLTASWAAAFALDPDGVTRTKTLGTDRMARKLADALPGGHSPLRASVWEFLRPMLSPRLASLHRDTFVFDEPVETTVELAVHRRESDLAHLDIGDDTEPATA